MAPSLSRVGCSSLYVPWVPQGHREVVVGRVHHVAGRGGRAPVPPGPGRPGRPPAAGARRRPAGLARLPAAQDRYVRATGLMLARRHIHVPCVMLIGPFAA